MPQKQVPVLGKAVPRSTFPPTPKVVQEPKKWAFSFRYWRQIEYFGLDRSNSSWFVSLLEKLQALSDEETEKFFCNPAKTDAWRYHKIDWGQKNIPVQLKDLYWLPPYCRENQEEFELVQFQISKALGRVVGFWDKDYVFNIVLLDPLHNIQPSKDYNYRVNACDPLSCDYTRLLNNIDDILDSKCVHRDCEFIDDIRNIRTNRDDLFECNVLMVKLTDDDLDSFNALIEDGKVTSLNKIFKDGIKANFDAL